jgi:hypothetical protein
MIVRSNPGRCFWCPKKDQKIHHEDTKDRGKQGSVIARQWNYSFDRLLIALLRVLRGFVVNLSALYFSTPPQVRSDQRA